MSTFLPRQFDMLPNRSQMNMQMMIMQRKHTHTHTLPDTHKYLFAGENDSNQRGFNFGFAVKNEAWASNHTFVTTFDFKYNLLLIAVIFNIK